MADITNDLIYSLMKKMHADIGTLKMNVGELKTEFGSMRGTMVAMQSDIHNIYGILARHDDRLDRIERRLELRELAEAQAEFDCDA